MDSGTRGDITGCELDADQLDEFRAEVIAGIMALAGTGGVENYFDERVEWEEPSPSPPA